jgi:hypothetical protein
MQKITIDSTQQVNLEVDTEPRKNSGRTHIELVVRGGTSLSACKEQASTTESTKLPT